jgi:hypothetical protein
MGVELQRAESSCRERSRAVESGAEQHAVAVLRFIRVAHGRAAVGCLVCRDVVGLLWSDVGCLLLLVGCVLLVGVSVSFVGLRHIFARDDWSVHD